MGFAALQAVVQVQAVDGYVRIVGDSVDWPAANHCHWGPEGCLRSPGPALGKLFFEASLRCDG